MWRRFLPPKVRLQRRSENLKADSQGDIFVAAKELIKSEANGRTIDIKVLADIVGHLKKRKNIDSTTNVALLLAQGPKAAVAQMEMDIHHGGYRNHKARLYELIDFNDSFVDTVLALPSAELETFPERLHEMMNELCLSVGVLMMTDKQFGAIVHGLSREIAVYKAARIEGFNVHMTSRVEDAHGVDMVITDKKGRTMNIDCKTRSSFHFRLIDIKRDHLISEEDRLQAEIKGFMVLRHGKHKDFVQTTLIRVATQELGQIRAFSFQDTKKMGDLLKRAMAAQ